MIRLFTALEIPDEAADRLLRLQKGLEGARWIERPDFHITLRFVGDVPEDVADEIDLALSGMKIEPFEIELEGIGAFGGAKPHSLWAGVKKSDALMHLQSRQENAMQRIGLKPEPRNFTPHVTIARFPRLSPEAIYRFIEANNLFAAPRFTVSHFTLFSARTSTGGGPYTAEKRYYAPGAEWAEEDDQAY